MKEVPIFIASSIVEFETERLQIGQFLDMLNGVYKRDGVRLEWNRPETMSHAYRDDGSQELFDDEIRASQFFVVIIGKKLGAATEHEFDVALEQFRKTGTPQIIPYFLNVLPSMDVLKFLDRLRKELHQYVDPYENFDVILNYLHIELIRGGAFKTDAAPSDRETAARNGLDGIRELISEHQNKIATLEAQPVTPEIIAEMTGVYEEIRRLVREYKIEPDALWAYMEFLHKQHLYSTGIEVGKWLESFYQLGDADKATWAALKDYLGLFYAGSNRPTQAEQYYREALELYRRLAIEYPKDFVPELAGICNNLANLLNITNHKEESENLHKEALEIRRRLAEENPAEFAPYLAHTCNNLANLLFDTNRIEEAETLYWEALELTEAYPDAFAPDLATTYNNLANLLKNTNRMEEAEMYYGEALEIRRRLAKENSAASAPDLASTCYNFGSFEIQRENYGAAKRYFKEALSLCEKFPHLEKYAQYCRDALAELEAEQQSP